LWKYNLTVLHQKVKTTTTDITAANLSETEMFSFIHKSKQLNHEVNKSFSYTSEEKEKRTRN